MLPPKKSSLFPVWIFFLTDSCLVHRLAELGPVMGVWVPAHEKSPAAVFGGVRGPGGTGRVFACGRRGQTLSPFLL